MVVRWIHALTVCAGAMMLAGCVQMTQPAPSWPASGSAAETVGALAGGALGGYIGSQFGGGTGALAMTGLGVTAGAALGRELGHDLENANHPPAANADRPPAQQYILLPHGYCLRPSNGAASTAGSQAANGLVMFPC